MYQSGVRITDTKSNPLINDLTDQTRSKIGSTTSSGVYTTDRDRSVTSERSILTADCFHNRSRIRRECVKGLQGLESESESESETADVFSRESMNFIKQHI